MSDPHEVLRNWLAAATHDHMRQAGEARERACEASIQSGVYGVMETWTRGDDGVSLGTVTFELSSKVPYGEIHVRMADEPWRPS